VARSSVRGTMGIDSRRVGLLAAGFMEELEAKYGEDANLTSLVLIASVDDGDNDAVEFRSTDFENPSGSLPVWKLVGLLECLRGALGR
jgi:hypothetical protein